MGQFVFICNFLSPGKARSKGYKTLASIGRHIEYIATRPGVALNEETMQMAEMQYQTTNVKSEEIENEIEQLNHDPEPEKEKDLEKYVQYIHERPKSHGLFGPDDEIIPDMSEIKRNLMNHKGLVWTAILSITEEDAIKLGLTTKEAWEKAIRATVTEAAGKMGIRPTNLDYVAAYHQKEGHPHAHLVFWEKEPDRTRGVLSDYERREMRKIFIKEIYAEENTRLYAQKTAVRDYIRNVAKDDLVKTVDFIRGIREAGLEVQALNGSEPGIAPIFREEKQMELYTKLMNLAEMLPGNGRIMLKFMSQDVKDEVKNIADWLLKQPGLIKSVDELKNISKEIASHYSNKPEDLKEAEDKAYNDARDRVSQVLLKAAVECQKDSIFTVNEKKAAEAVKTISQAYKPLSFDKEKELAAKTFVAAMNESMTDRPEIAKAIDKWNHLTKAGLSEEQCVKIKEHVLKEEDISFNSLEHLSNTTDYKKAKIMAASLKAVGHDQEAATNVIREVFTGRIKAIQEKIDTLEKAGYLVKNDDQYDMTDKLKQVIVKIRVPDKLERSILAFYKDKTSFTIQDLLHDKAVIKLAGETYSQQREFKFGKYDANVIFNLFTNNTVTLKQLKNIFFDRHTDEVKAEEEFNNTIGRIEKLVEHGYVKKDQENEAYSITSEGLQAAEEARKAFSFTSYDANVVFKYIERANGSLNREKLEKLLAEDYKDPEHIKQQLKYLIKRLDNNVKIGTVEKNQSDEYKITDKGLDEAEAISFPYKSVVVDRLEYLAELGLLEYDNGIDGYRVTNKELLEQTLQNRHLNLKDTPIDKELYKLIEDARGHIKETDIEKRLQEYINSIVNDYESIKTGYESIRDQYRVESTIARVLGDMSKILITAGLEREEALNIIIEWNEKSGMKIGRQVIEETLSKVIDARAELKVWNREMVIGVERWKELFKDLGIEKDKIPKWMFEGQFSQHITTFLNKAWKAAFRAVHKECAKAEAQAEILKKQNIRQQQLENESYRREMIKKMKTRAIFEEQELE